MGIDPDAIAEIRFFLPSQGGRRTNPKPSKFYTCPLFVEGNGFDCRILTNEKIIHLGTTYQFSIVFLNWDFASPHMKAGTQFLMWEGKNIGEGRILEVMRASA